MNLTRSDLFTGALSCFLGSPSPMLYGRENTDRLTASPCNSAVSMKMNGVFPMRCRQKLNRILWRQAKGRNQQYPAWKQGRAVFTPSASDDDDDEDED